MKKVADLEINDINDRNMIILALINSGYLIELYTANKNLSTIYQFHHVIVYERKLK
jgi:hypothetical protein